MQNYPWTQKTGRAHHHHSREVLHLILTRVRPARRSLRTVHPHAIVQSLLHRTLPRPPNVGIVVPILHVETVPRVAQFVKLHPPLSPQVAILQAMFGDVPFHPPAFQGGHPVPHEPTGSGVEAPIPSGDGRHPRSVALGFVDPDGGARHELLAGRGGKAIGCRERVRLEA